MHVKIHCCLYAGNCIEFQWRAMLTGLHLESRGGQVSNTSNFLFCSKLLAGQVNKDLLKIHLSDRIELYVQLFLMSFQQIKDSCQLFQVIVKNSMRPECLRKSIMRSPTTTCMKLKPPVSLGLQRSEKG